MRSRSKKVVVNDSFQKSYEYVLTESEGKNFDPEFRPMLTPTEMFELGVFGGKYLNECIAEFPKHWFKKAILSDIKDPSLNFFGVNASKDLQYWKQKGWMHRDDPRGWFQWYCRYWMGRRIPEEDQRQIHRWKNMKRHVIPIINNCREGDYLCRPRQRQAVLHWAYDSREW